MIKIPGKEKPRDRIEFTPDQLKELEILRNKVVKTICREVDPLRQVSILVYNIFNEYLNQKQEDINHFAKIAVQRKNENEEDMFN